MSGRQTWVETLLDFIQDPQLNKDNVVCWNEKGDGFLMVNKAKKKEALAKFFNTSDPESFRRNLNYHGFKSIGRSPTHYTHPHMRRHDRAYTLRFVTRTDPAAQQALASSTAGAGTGTGAPESPAAAESDAEDAASADTAPTATLKRKAGFKAGGGSTASEQAKPRKATAAGAPTKRSRSKDSGSGVDKDSRDGMEEDEQDDGAEGEGETALAGPCETRVSRAAVLPTHTVAGTAAWESRPAGAVVPSAVSTLKQQKEYVMDETSYAVVSDGDGVESRHAPAVSQHQHKAPAAHSSSASASVSAVLSQVTEVEEAIRRKRRRSGEDDAARQQQGRQREGDGGSVPEEPGSSRAPVLTTTTGTTSRLTRFSAGSLKPPLNVPVATASSAPPSAGPAHEPSGPLTAGIGVSPGGHRHASIPQAQWEGSNKVEASTEGGTAGTEPVAKKEADEGRLPAAYGTRGRQGQAPVSSSAATAAAAGEIMAAEAASQDGKQRAAGTDRPRKDVRAPEAKDGAESSEGEGEGSGTDGTGEMSGPGTARGERGRGKGTSFLRDGKPTRSAAAASSAAVTKAMKAKLEGMSEEEKRINAPLLQGSHPLPEHPSLATLSRCGSAHVQPEPSAPVPPADDPDDAAFFLLGLTQSGASGEAPLAIRPPIPEDGPCGAGIGGMPCAKPTCHTCNTVTGTPRLLKDGVLPSLGYMHRPPATTSTTGQLSQVSHSHMVGRSDSAGLGPIVLGNGLPVHVRAPLPVPAQGHAHAGQQYGGGPHITQQSQHGGLSLGQEQGQGQGPGVIVWMPMQYAGNGQYRPLQANEIPLQPMAMSMGHMGSSGQQGHMSSGGSVGGQVSMGPPAAPHQHQQQPGPQYCASNNLPVFSQPSAGPAREVGGGMAGVGVGVGGRGQESLGSMGRQQGGMAPMQPQGLPMAQGAAPGTIYYYPSQVQGQGMGQGQQAGPSVMHQLNIAGPGASQPASLGSLGTSGLSMSVAGGQAADMTHSVGPAGALPGPPLTVQQAQAYANTGVKLPSGAPTTQALTQHQYAYANTGVKFPSNNALSVQS